MSAAESGAVEAASAAAATVGAKVGLGMAGAAVLYLVMPPERPDGTFSKREFAARLVVAGFASAVFGGWLVSVVHGIAPWLQAQAHPAPFWMAAGAPGWWISRAVALWLYKRRDKDVAEMVKDVRPPSP